MRNEFYQESSAVFLIFDVTLRTSFNSLESWFKEASELGAKEAIFYVIGNKVLFS